MLSSSRLSLLALLAVLASSSASAALGPDTYMPGLSDQETWERIYKRSEAIAKEVKKKNPNATAQEIECARLTVLVQAYRRAQSLDALRDAAVVSVHMTTKEGPHQGGLVRVPQEPGKPKAERVWQYEAEEPGGATEKVVQEYNRKCHGDDEGGGGSSGPGSPAVGGSMAQAWLNAHPDWDVDEAYGPPMLPGDPLHLGAQLRKLASRSEVREQVAKSYPGAQFDALVGRFISGKASGQDVEQLRVVLGLGGSALILDKVKGLVSARAGVFPIWWVPSDSVLPSYVRPTRAGEGL